MVTTTLTQGGAAAEGSTAEGHLPEEGHLPAAEPAPPGRKDDRKNTQPHATTNPNPEVTKLTTPKVLGRDGAGRGGLSDCVSCNTDSRSIQVVVT